MGRLRPVWQREKSVPVECLITGGGGGRAAAPPLTGRLRVQRENVAGALRELPPDPTAATVAW
jgi:hypothetical protein